MVTQESKKRIIVAAIVLVSTGLIAWALMAVYNPADVVETEGSFEEEPLDLETQPPREEEQVEKTSGLDENKNPPIEEPPPGQKQSVRPSSKKASK